MELAIGVLDQRRASSRAPCHEDDLAAVVQCADPEAGVDSDLGLADPVAEPDDRLHPVEGFGQDTSAGENHEAAHEGEDLDGSHRIPFLGEPWGTERSYSAQLPPCEACIKQGVSLLTERCDRSFYGHSFSGESIDSHTL